MQVKIDTKEKFTVITPEITKIAANLAEKWQEILLTPLSGTCKNVVLNLEMVEELEAPIALLTAEVQHRYYEKNASFVICGLQDAVEKNFEALEILEILNITPTESEAWDIVQMEEIERELLDDASPEFNEFKEEDE